MPIHIYTVGQKKEKWLFEAIDVFTKRVDRHSPVTWHYIKKTSDLFKQIEKIPFVALDPKGTLYTSEAFTSWLMKQFEKAPTITFVIGDSNGLEENILQKAFHTISLSPLTFTHEMARLLLIEQLYRAFMIKEGHPYHK